MRGARVVVRRNPQGWTESPVRLALECFPIRLNSREALWIRFLVAFHGRAVPASLDNAPNGRKDLRYAWRAGVRAVAVATASRVMADRSARRSPGQIVVLIA